MDIEFDPEKSQTNKAKHGIDFETAQSLWLDPKGLTVPAKNIGSRDQICPNRPNEGRDLV